MAITVQLTSLAQAQALDGATVDALSTIEDALPGLREFAWLALLVFAGARATSNPQRMAQSGNKFPIFHPISWFAADSLAVLAVGADAVLGRFLVLST